jgi:predicted dehydrogenase/kynurenine formamidase
MKRWRGLCIGAGYFSQFHYDAWGRMPEVEIACVCDQDEAKARAAAQQVDGAAVCTDAAEALARFEVDFVDIITPPATHMALVEAAAKRGRAIICQKPLAPEFAAARQIVELAEKHGVRLMVHENFRFQPWHREIRRLIDTGAIGDRLHSLTFRSRPGDGWGEDAYLSRQPYFRQMPRLLVHETGVHFIDTFRYLAGEIEEAQGVLRRLNPVIAGEDAGLLTFRFVSGAVGVWDANRWNESNFPDPRYTFGEFLVEGSGGTIRLDGDGRLTLQPLGEPEREHAYSHERRGFGGDCVLATQRHFIECLASGAPFETEGREYLRTLEIVEAVYEAARTGQRVRCPQEAKTLTPALSQREREGKAGRRVYDLSLPVDNEMRGVSITPLNTIEQHGYNTTTLSLYSHSGTHMDAVRHFVPEGATLERQSLEVCCGPALVINIAPVEPRELISVERLAPWAARLEPGERLLLRTDWYKRYGTDEYRNALPRISPELARWLVEKQVCLLGVEPPSVADVNSREELTVVHQILLRGGVTIIEGLANLDQLPGDRVEFIALPLKIVGGDGCPVRAVAREI